MSSFSIQEAQDFTTFALQTVERLAAAKARFDSTHDEPTEERGWLEVASSRVTSRLENLQKALSDAAELPEFASARKVNREALSNAWADAIEGLFDAIVANVSANGPLVEALFPHQRFATLRKPGSAAQNFWLEFERRADSAYVRRLCADPEYAFLPPLLEAARSSERSLREAASPRPLPEERALELRETISVATQELELALRQARSLVDAVFAATPMLVAELNLDAKPKRRTQRPEAAKASPS